MLEKLADYKRLLTVIGALILFSPLLVQWLPQTHSQSVAGATSPEALVVYAQPDFTTSRMQATGPDTLKNAGSITADAHGGFYVVDYDNNRVLHFPTARSIGPGPQADQVYGQPDYTSYAPAINSVGLNHPHGVALALDGGLYIADMLNNRVLHYPAGSVVADKVYGQAIFTSNIINNGGLSASSLFHPQGLAVDATGFYVADSSNNRVLHFPVGSQLADQVYGQARPGESDEHFTTNNSGNGNAGLNTPRDIAVDSTGLYVADSGNHRIVHYTIGNPYADRVYGQPDFAPTSTQANQGLAYPTARTLNNPTGLAIDALGSLYVADRNNNRVLYFPPSAQSGENDPAAVSVYGQPGYTSNSSSTSSHTFNGPGGVTVDTYGDIFVLDIFNQRVLKFITTIPPGRSPCGPRGQAY